VLPPHLGDPIGRVGHSQQLVARPRDLSTQVPLGDTVIIIIVKIVLPLVADVISLQFFEDELGEGRRQLDGYPQHPFVAADSVFERLYRGHSSAHLAFATEAQTRETQRVTCDLLMR
jgi:hypothetical protein